MRTRGSAALVVAVALMAGAAGCGTGGGTSAGTGPSAVPLTPGAPLSPAPLPTGLSVAPTAPPEPGGPCPDSGVRVFLGLTEGALGLRAMGVLLDNCGTRPFEVSGYPDVAVLDERREKLDVTVRLGTDSAGGTASRSTFVLRPGERAHASVLWRNTVTRADVTATSGAYLRVRPAPGVETQTVAPHDGPLDLGNTDAVEVTPWAPAKD